MGYEFTQADIDEISKILDSKAKAFDGGWSWVLKSVKNNYSLVINLYKSVKIGREHTGALVSIQTQHGYFELHDCTGYLIFEPDEIFFLQSNDKYVSSLIIGKECTCSMFSNINREIINADFSTLDPAVLLSAMQLSLTENVLV